MMKKKKSTKKLSYKPSAYLRKSIAEGDKELAEGKIVWYEGTEALFKSLRL